MSDQRWLSLDGIASVLGTSASNILWLARNGYLVSIKGQDQISTRYLDPTPEYAERLRLGETVYGRRFPIDDIENIPMLSLREIGEIMGWSVKKQQNEFFKTSGSLHGKGRLVGKYRLFTVEEVRQVLWKIEGRTIAHQRAPFLIRHLVDFFLKRQDQTIPTDIDFAEDDVLVRQMARLSKMRPRERDKAMVELMEKIAVAQDFVARLRTLSGVSPSSSRPSSVEASTTEAAG